MVLIASYLFVCVWNIDEDNDCDILELFGTASFSVNLLTSVG